MRLVRCGHRTRDVIRDQQRRLGRVGAGRDDYAVRADDLHERLFGVSDGEQRGQGLVAQERFHVTGTDRERIVDVRAQGIELQGA